MNLIVCSVPKNQGYGKLKMHSESDQQTKFPWPDSADFWCQNFGKTGFLFHLKHQSGNSNHKILTLLTLYWHGQIDLICCLGEVLSAIFKELDYCVIKFTDFYMLG